MPNGAVVDFFNPNFWIKELHEFRIYGDDNAFHWAIVDEEDYHWAIKWRWHINKPHPTRNGKKLYMRRVLSNSKRYIPPLYLHVEIHKRTGIIQPSPLHTFVDHIDGNELNCLRSNLRWVTPQMNRQNARGYNACSFI